MTEIFYRNLPLNATYFITFRLAGSLPLDALARMRQDYEQLAARLQGQELYSIADKDLRALRNS